MIATFLMVFLAGVGAQELDQVFTVPDIVKSTSREGLIDINGGPEKVASYGPCILETGASGICVPYYLCEGNNTLIVDGKGIIDARINNSPCMNYMETCCGSDDVTNNSSRVTTELPSIVTDRKGCGWRNPTGVGFTVTGAQDGMSQFGEFPWIVAILELKAEEESKKNQTVNVYVGGGSLIHRSVVLTVAHYVASKPAETFKVRAGEWDTQTEIEPYEYQNRAVKDIVVHKDFNKRCGISCRSLCSLLSIVSKPSKALQERQDIEQIRAVIDCKTHVVRLSLFQPIALPENLQYDIALMFLESPVNLAPHVGVACLPPARSEALDGAKCFASGWGIDKFGKEGRYQVTLKKVEVPVVDRHTCQKKLRESRLGRLFQLHRTFMCAGGERGVDTCRGDGGAPLVCPIEYETDRLMQYGIVAWGIGCGEFGYPGVYVDVAVMRTWIDDQVIRMGHDVESYTY